VAVSASSSEDELDPAERLAMDRRYLGAAGRGQAE
jgi:hypothetical protein